MKIVLQRVKKASVTVDGTVISSINAGLLLLVGVSGSDNTDTALKMARKISRFRIFKDDQDKMNLDIRQVGGSVLSVPQFTLLGDTEQGNRPGFDNAAEPKKAKEIWKIFNCNLEECGVSTAKGEFGAHMDVALINDGPVTFVLESEKGGHNG